MTHLNRQPPATAYYRVQWVHTGLWAVVHAVPGTNVLAVDKECGTVQGAERECAYMNYEREQEQRREAQRQQLLGMRWGRLA